MVNVRPVLVDVTLIVPVAVVQVGCVMVTVGAVGVAFGAATPLPAGLTQVPTVDVTVYVPASLHSY